MDKFSKEMRSGIMSKIHSKGTKVEQIVFKELRRRKIYFQAHYKNVPGNPDIALPRKKCAIFIDGDFWHGYELQKLKNRLPENYWMAKIERNVKRDRKNRAELRKMGWDILRVWEHEVYDNLDEVINHIVLFITSGLAKIRCEKKINWMRVKELAWANLVLEEAGIDLHNLLGFDFCGYWVIDPFTDENGVNEVNPVEYYKSDFLNSPFTNPKPTVRYPS
jgi:DNA mismatch endonuclease (patch repair protein)